MATTEPAPIPDAIAGAYSFRDLTTLTRWLEGLLTLYIVVRVANMLSDIAQSTLLEQAGRTPMVELREWATANDQRQQLMAVALLATLLVVVVVFSCWIVRANRNARALGAVGMTFTPGWSVGWFFVPIASLWKPFQAMREIWKASADPINWSAAPTDPLLGWWWAGFVASSLLGQVSFRMSMAAKTLDSLKSYTAVSILDDLVDVVATGLALALVERLCRIQRARVGLS